MLSVALSLRLPPPDVIRHHFSMESGLSSPLQERSPDQLIPYGYWFQVKGQEPFGFFHLDKCDASRQIHYMANLYPFLQTLPCRGKLTRDAPLAPLTWFRTGGTADVLFAPQDEEDLSLFLSHLPLDCPVFVLGLGSNLLVRDGGMRGVVIRLPKSFASLEVLPDHRITAGTAVADVKVARLAAERGISGFSFLRGIPGVIGGALRMNGGAYGGEMSDILVEAHAIDRQGKKHIFTKNQMGFSYRHCDVSEELIFTSALMQGTAGVSETILAEMNAITDARSATQPVNTRTGGSTFKNPPGHKAWALIDAAGCRGLREGDAGISELHCNFMINHGSATAHDVETLGEKVRQRVFDISGLWLEWEIKRVGEPTMADDVASFA